MSVHNGRRQEPFASVSDRRHENNHLRGDRRNSNFVRVSFVRLRHNAGPLPVVTDSPRKPSTVLQFIKGIVSRRVLGYLKEKNYETSLRKLEHDGWKRNHRYSLWQHDSDVFSIVSESTFMQKVNYIHQNPVRAGLVERTNDYRWSSARLWSKCPNEDEPVRADTDKIVWRRS